MAVSSTGVTARPLPRSTRPARGNITGTGHTYADDGPYTVTITVTEEAGAGPGSDDETFSVTVADVAPTIAISGAANVNEGTPYSLTLGAITDPGSNTIRRAYIVTGVTATPTPTAPMAPEPHLRRWPGHPLHHRRPGRRGRHLPQPRQCLSVGHGRQCRPQHRHLRRRQRQRGRALQPDPGRRHRSGQRHG